MTENHEEPADARALLDAGGWEPSAKEQASLRAHAAGENPAPGKTDREGRAFSPLLHETGRDGKPALTKDGKLRKKRGDNWKRGWALYQRANKEGGHAGAGATDPGDGDAVQAVRLDPGPVAGPAADGGGDVGLHPDLRLPVPAGDGAAEPAGGGVDPNRDGMAREAFGVVLLIITSLLAFFLGRKWLLKGDETSAMEQAGGRVFSRWGWTHMPPEVMLATHSGAYVGSRLEPATLDRIKAWLGKPFRRQPPPPAEGEQDREVRPGGH